jgi:acyl carrier protein
MAEKTIEQRVKDIIVEQLGVNADQVTPTPSSSRSGADSLDTVELVMALEENSAMRFPTSAEKLQSVATINTSKTCSKNNRELSTSGAAWTVISLSCPV